MRKQAVGFLLSTLSGASILFAILFDYSPPTDFSQYMKYARCPSAL